MLVLSRQIDGVICIGNDIAITVVEIRGKTVRLGITAPSGVQIIREEHILPVPETAEEANQ